jgi:ribosomal protein S18 acetylase RimI-like enzyme
MNHPAQNLFANPVWHALHTRHRGFAQGLAEACRYPADVAPFAAVAEPSAMAMQQLHALLAPLEWVWVIGENSARTPGLSIEEALDCLQMIMPEDRALPEPLRSIVGLGDKEAPEMFELANTTAFPGFFRRRTHEMGSYLGVRSEGALIAMGGERLMLDGYPELSGICTHTAYRGKGLAAGIIAELVRNHRRDGLVSWLQVAVSNSRAIDLYSRLGFTALGRVTLHRYLRTD